MQEKVEILRLSAIMDDDQACIPDFCHGIHSGHHQKKQICKTTTPENNVYPSLEGRLDVFQDFFQNAELTLSTAQVKRHKKREDFFKERKESEALVASLKVGLVIQFLKLIKEGQPVHLLGVQKKEKLPHFKKSS